MLVRLCLCMCVRTRLMPFLLVQWDQSRTSIGRRYARADELGIPYAVTVEHDSHVTESLTLRERDSTAQIRVPLKDIAAVVDAAASGSVSFKELMGKYPIHNHGEFGPAAGAGAGAAAGAAAAGAGAGAGAGTGVPASAVVVEDTGAGRFSRPSKSIL